MHDLDTLVAVDGRPAMERTVDLAGAGLNDGSLDILRTECSTHPEVARKRVLLSQGRATAVSLARNALGSVPAWILLSPRLLSLDVSDNHLTGWPDTESEAPGRRPRLVALRAGRNRLTCLDGIPSLRFLRRLDISGNSLRSLAGVARLPFLEELDASSNALQHVADLDNPALHLLDVSSNAIASVDGMHRLPALVTLLAGSNRIRDVHALEHCSYLRALRLDNNRLAALGDLLPLEALGDLESLDVRGCPACPHPQGTVAPDGDETWARILFSLPQLELLNGQQVTSMDRVKVQERYGVHDSLYQRCHETFFPGEPHEAFSFGVPLSRRRNLPARGGADKAFGGKLRVDAASSPAAGGAVGFRLRIEVPDPGPVTLAESGGGADTGRGLPSQRRAHSAGAWRDRPPVSLHDPARIKGSAREPLRKGHAPARGAVALGSPFTERTGGSSDSELAHGLVRSAVSAGMRDASTSPSRRPPHQRQSPR